MFLFEPIQLKLQSINTILTCSKFDKKAGDPELRIDSS